MAKQFSNYLEGGDTSRVATPVKINIGQRNIRVSDDSLHGNLGRDIEAAIGKIAKDLTWFFRQVDDAIPSDMMHALKPTLDLSAEYCPKDTHELVNSRYLAMEQFRGNPRAEMGYARNGDPHYAVIVHEVPATHAEGTFDKFLERALNEDYYAIQQRLVDGVRTRLGF